MGKINKISERIKALSIHLHYIIRNEFDIELVYDDMNKLQNLIKTLSELITEDEKDET